MDVVRNELVKISNLRNDPWKLVLIGTTLIGGWSVFPSPPKVLGRMFSKDNYYHDVWKHAMLFALLYQGGGGEDITISLAGTVAFFLLREALDALDEAL